jgi:hypothetical protein
MGMGDSNLQAVGVLGSACQVPAKVYQESWQLQAWGIQDCGQRAFWGLFASAGFWEHGTEAAAGTGEPSLGACSFCHLWSSRGPGSCYTEVPVSLVVQGEGSRSCSWRKHGDLRSCVCREAGLNAASAE